MIAAAEYAGYALAAVITIGLIIFSAVVSALSNDWDEPQ